MTTMTSLQLKDILAFWSWGKKKKNRHHIPLHKFSSAGMYRSSAITGDIWASGKNVADMHAENVLVKFCFVSFLIIPKTALGRNFFFVHYMYFKAHAHTEILYTTLANICMIKTVQNYKIWEWERAAGFWIGFISEGRGQPQRLVIGAIKSPLTPTVQAA